MNRTIITSIVLAAACSTAVLAGGGGGGAERSVQIRSIDFTAGTLELHNFGGADIDLSGWRFCSHDFNQLRRYSGASGFNGMTIEAGTSVMVHYNNDAPAGPDAVNRSDLGGFFALPLAPVAYGIQIFHPNAGGLVSFGDSSLISDHLMWAEDAGAVGTAGFRADQAVSEGLWSATTDFIDTEPGSMVIMLTDDTGGTAHGPANYAVDPCAADLTNDGVVDSGDLSLFITLFLAGDLAVDLTNDGVVDSGDLSLFISLFLAGC